MEREREREREREKKERETLLTLPPLVFLTKVLLCNMFLCRVELEEFLDFSKSQSYVCCCLCFAAVVIITTSCLRTALFAFATRGRVVGTFVFFSFYLFHTLSLAQPVLVYSFFSFSLTLVKKKISTVLNFIVKGNLNK